MNQLVLELFRSVLEWRIARVIVSKASPEPIPDFFRIGSKLNKQFDSFFKKRTETSNEFEMMAKIPLTSSIMTLVFEFGFVCWPVSFYLRFSFSLPRSCADFKSLCFRGGFSIISVSGEEAKTSSLVLAAASSIMSMA
jgi:hypothetical protein